MATKQVFLGILLAIVTVAGNLAPHSALAQTTERSAAIPRPDLSLTARDMPPGFEERTAEFMRVGDVSIEDRLLVRPGGGLGSYWVWNATYLAARTPTEESFPRSVNNMAVILSRTFNENVVLSDWTDLDVAGLGDMVSLRSFRYHNVVTDAEADGALVVLARGDIVSVLAVLSTDGHSAGDARRFARLVDSRIQQDTLAVTR